ncbi:uncharacterized protein MELLADRAFT_69975 [Melampsora larici-populina 98AG31]|uniref:Uncharacterized protein n=1 Tax=Melampsora larici-populina (strain 98AG31 / pathotype 3-4-7) TaxID=747676 RepID=F4SD06_MELLP|nr:uncharacterized protein MELLADRAFT_69975 [Melampsora larici-populina 98AG31]EGF97470.1 hypothetical protein MELLADRAFT_69975 [Melampsora larici-populina 98AG31]
MSAASPPTHHSIYLSGNFEIENRVSPITIAGSGPEYTTYAVSIGCRGGDRDARLLYEIRATESNNSPAPPKAKTDGNGIPSKKPVKFVSRAVSSPFISPIPASSSSQTLVSGSGEVSQLAVESGSGSSPALSLPSTSSSVPKASKTTGQPPKKRARAPPKSKNKKSASIPETL